MANDNNQDLPQEIQEQKLSPSPGRQAPDQAEEEISLQDFIEDPDTVPFITVNNRFFRQYIRDKYYIRIGTYFNAGNYVVGYSNKQYVDQNVADLGDFNTQMLTLLDQKSNDAAGISPILQQPNLNLSGKGVLLGFVDTGIDFTKDAFRYEDGTSKIKYIWDQSISGNPPKDLHFGAVYTQEEINEALTVENPASIISHLDESGHGTFLASVAASREKGNYQGVARDSEIIAVKIRRANLYYFRRFDIPMHNNAVFDSIDVALGIHFILEKANVGFAHNPVASG